MTPGRLVVTPLVACVLTAASVMAADTIYVNGYGAVFASPIAADGHVSWCNR